MKLLTELPDWFLQQVDDMIEVIEGEEESLYVIGIEQKLHEARSALLKLRNHE